MMLLKRTRIDYLWIVLLLLMPNILTAQKSNWETIDATKTVGKKATSTKQKLKSYKEHLQNWGTDTTYKYAILLGGKLNSDGWSGSMYFAKRRNYKISTIWQLHFSEIKHEKQSKQLGSNSTFPELGQPTKYVFGKINNLYALQVGVGKEILILPAVLEGNLSVSFRYTGGISFAMLKPYYLKLIYIDNTTPTETAHVEQHKYSKSDSATFLNPNTIFGSSKWNKGLNEIDYVPGVYLETAFVIVPGKNKFFIQVITLGINGAFYAKPLHIMVDQQSYPWQVSLFAGLAIGERWK